MDNFDPPFVHMKALCKNLSVEFAGALLRLHSGAMAGMLKMGAPINDIFKAAKEAGCQLVKEGEMSQETLDIVSRELRPRGMYIQILNQHVQQSLEALENVNLIHSFFSIFVNNSKTKIFLLFFITFFRCLIQFRYIFPTSGLQAHPIFIIELP